MINVNIHNTYITNIQLWFVFFPERALGLALHWFQNVPINTQVFPQKLSWAELRNGFSPESP